MLLPVLGGEENGVTDEYEYEYAYTYEYAVR
jgi:hypothetical protein